MFQFSEPISRGAVDVVLTELEWCPMMWSCAAV